MTEEVLADLIARCGGCAGGEGAGPCPLAHCTDCAEYECGCFAYEPCREWLPEGQTCDHAECRLWIEWYEAMDDDTKRDFLITFWIGPTANNFLTVLTGVMEEKR